MKNQLGGPSKTGNDMLERGHETRPSLLGAKQRNARAGHHLLELENSLRKTNANENLRLVAGAEEVSFDLSQAKRPTTSWIAIVAGEAAYNLRAALDYLVYSLAWLDSGRPHQRTQFPIASSPKQWRSQKSGFLSGVSEEHVKRIRRLQPMGGCQWTEVLRELNNPDKHRSLTAVYVQYEVDIKGDAVATAQANELVPVGQRKAQFCFWDGRPVIETLTELAIEVGRVLVDFQSDFGETDQLKLRDSN